MIRGDEKSDYKTLSGDKIAELVKDKRIFVSDNALQRLIDAKDESIQAVKKTLLSSDDEELRAKAVFILGRIDTEASMTAVRDALNDKGAVVKTAAVRMLGLARDKKSSKN